MADMDKVLARIFSENQDKLPESKRIAQFDKAMCLDSNISELQCTLPVGHSGEHIAHGRLGYIIEEWPQN